MSREDDLVLYNRKLEHMNIFYIRYDETVIILIETNMLDESSDDLGYKTFVLDFDTDVPAKVQKLLNVH